MIFTALKYSLIRVIMQFFMSRKSSIVINYSQQHNSLISFFNEKIKILLIALVYT